VRPTSYDAAAVVRFLRVLFESEHSLLAAFVRDH
jgi:hypothetical protein